MLSFPEVRMRNVFDPRPGRQNPVTARRFSVCPGFERFGESANSANLPYFSRSKGGGPVTDEAMSEQTLESEVKTQDAVLTKLFAQLNEERLLKDIASVQMSRFKSMDDLMAEAKAGGREAELRTALEENLTEHPDSLVSRYSIGCLAMERQDRRGVSLLRSLLEEFRQHAKWTVVDHIADRILAVEEDNRIALRAKVESTERLKGKKELKPYLEKLASIDRKNPDIVKKYALSILEEDRERAVKNLKMAGETYARIKDYPDLEEIWNLLVQHDHKDLPWFERIERILVGNREKTRVAAYLVSLLEPFRTEESWSAVIAILKKILEYEPGSTRARSDLVRAYRARHEGHSLLDDFLKLSDLTNNKRPVGPAISSFERNIVFDRENYVFHRTRGVGKISSIDSDQVVIDFEGSPGQLMSIQMAITSLKPLEPDHIWVRLHENPNEVKELFNEDQALFFEALLSSFGNKMTLAEIKTEIVGRFIEPDEWSKWWSRARARLKKEPKFGFNPRKKDELHLRDTPMTLSEELTLKFQAIPDWNQKLELAMETLKEQDTEGAAELCVQFFQEQEEHKDQLKQIHSHLFLKAAAAALGDDDADTKLSDEAFDAIFAGETAEKLVQYCAETTVVELKREIVNTIIRTREDYPDILSRILFELPIKVNRYVISELNRLGQKETLTKFLDRVRARFKEHPEIFLWVARSILTDQWTYPWINASKEAIVLLLFRLLKPLSRIETKGTRLKNNAVESLFGTTNITVETVHKGVLPEILKNAELSTIRRMSAIFREVPYIPEAHKENLMALIQDLRPDFTSESDFGDDDEIEEEGDATNEYLNPGEDTIFVSAEGLEKRRKYLDRLINVEMPANSHDIGEAQERGDLRENAEYKAAMERQSQLQAEIKQVDAELKKAQPIDPGKISTHVVSIGTKVTLLNGDGETMKYRILGPWDADAERFVISYKSPLGRALIGKHQGETAVLENQRFEIQAITQAL